MKKEIQDTKDLKMTAIIVSGILGFITIIGIFFGEQAIKNLLLGIALLVCLIIFIGLMTISKPKRK